MMGFGSGSPPWIKYPGCSRCEDQRRAYLWQRAGYCLRSAASPRHRQKAMMGLGIGSLPRIEFSDLRADGCRFVDEQQLRGKKWPPRHLPDRMIVPWWRRFSPFDARLDRCVELGALDSSQARWNLPERLSRKKARSCLQVRKKRKGADDPRRNADHQRTGVISLKKSCQRTAGSPGGTGVPFEVHKKGR
mmetsp:Transcript_140250/g.244208  ORF Transcript_140250/g.244208 Transcript_140250/m.244208 type:complete len:190 (+) Transcript_140250:539-1108(+)